MRTILVIEDEQPLREAICDILEFEGYIVFQAENGKDGVEQTLQHLPDIILCDVMMPVMNGKEVLAALRLKETTRLIPFIFITALSGRSDIRSAMELGADDYINKPVTRDELLGAITARLKKSDVILKKTRHTAELESINKDLNAFAQAVSHDLKTPLRAVDGYTKMLHDDYAGILDKDGLRYLETIRSNSAKMRELIDGLLEFSRQRKTEIAHSRVNMNNLARSVIADIRYEKNYKIPEIILGDIPDAGCDEKMMRQVFVNLLSNAIKYSGKKDKPVIEIGHSVINNESVYYVKDNGVGFDMKYYSKLFGVFHRLHSQNEFKGIGIGLSIVKEIIEKHGGRVWAEGIVDEGTTFYFSLPELAGNPS
ncbi:MAG: response regulator [Bacteroidetes bacterium]|nr:response regulator [Bacteroidota bacterium]